VRWGVLVVLVGLLLVLAPDARAALVVRPTGPVALHVTPGGRVVASLGTRSDYGSPLVLAVAAKRGDWLGVRTPALPNGRLGWIRATAGPISEVRMSISVNLAARVLTLRKDGAVVARIDVAIGARGTPTPVGVFAVTDKLAGPRFGRVYGCCILALSAHQPLVPHSWTPGDYRVAIHGGGGIGDAVSAGCLHASERSLRYLMAHVPLGTPVTIR
jgi:lipoprotein-anchoring transpeptidase ErfK/SrfK